MFLYLLCPVRFLETVIHYQYKCDIYAADGVEDFHKDPWNGGFLAACSTIYYGVITEVTHVEFVCNLYYCIF